MALGVILLNILKHLGKEKGGLSKKNYSALMSASANSKHFGLFRINHQKITYVWIISSNEYVFVCKYLNIFCHQLWDELNTIRRQFNSLQIFKGIIVGIYRVSKKSKKIVLY